MQFLKNNWLKISAIIFLMWALADNPYGYYQFLRWVVLFTGAFSAYWAYQSGSKSWPWIFGVIAVLFNPIIPLTFQRETWQVIDVVVAVVFLASIFNIKTNKKES